MKTLIKLADSINKSSSLKGKIIFEGSAARATDNTLHAVIENGDWNFDCATIVDTIQLKTALAINPKKPKWEGDTLNGIKLGCNYLVSDFPVLPVMKPLTRIRCDKLAESIGKVMPACADKDIRYYLNGVMLDHAKGLIVGCDGHRVHIVNNAFSSDENGQSILPRDAIDLVGVKNLLNLDLNDTHFRLSYVGGAICGALVDGKFPDIDRVIPHASDRPATARFNGAQCDAIETITKVCKANKVLFPTIIINPTGELVACDVKIPCFDEFKVQRLADKSGNLVGQEFYGVNGNYVRDAMLTAKSGVIRIAGANDSLLVIADDFNAVIMPCRV